MTSVFGDLITLASKAENISIEFFNDGWVHRYTKGNKVRFSYGYQFDLNTGVSQQLATDKCAAYQFLHNADCPVVAHKLISNWQQDDSGKWQRAATDQMHIHDVAKHLSSDFGLPVVTKPVTGTSGQDVSLARNMTQLTSQLAQLLQKYDMAAASPYIEATTETRLYLLDGLCVLAYQKQKPKNEWRFNLSHGATTQLITPSQDLISTASKAMNALGLRLGAVDFLQTKQGPIILEVNSGIMLNNFASQNPQQKEIAIKIYRQILQNSFTI